MNHHAREVSERLLRSSYDELGEREKRVAHHVAERRHISRNLAREHVERLTLGQSLADKVATFGGSWTFIALFGSVLVGWVALNSWLLLKVNGTFDPYPYILLNLFLSMLAAVQAPIILMSQNRQAQKDRVTAEHDYEINLKAELEIMALHEKVDALRERQWSELLALQMEQLKRLEQLYEDVKRRTP